MVFIEKDHIMALGTDLKAFSNSSARQAAESERMRK